MTDVLRTLLLLPVLLATLLIAVWVSPKPNNRLSCVSGDVARNPVGQSGEDVPASITFPTIEEGEAFICLDVPQLPEVDGWEVRNVNAERSQSLERFEPGRFVSDTRGYRFLAINYLNPGLEGLITFDFTVYPEAFLRQLGIETMDDLTYSVCPAVRLPLRREPLLTETATIRGTEASVSIYTDSPGRGLAQNLFVCWQRDSLIYSAYARFGPPLDYRTDILPWLETVR